MGRIKRTDERRRWPAASVRRSATKLTVDARSEPVKVSVSEAWELTLPAINGRRRTAALRRQGSLVVRQVRLSLALAVVAKTRR